MVGGSWGQASEGPALPGAVMPPGSPAVAKTFPLSEIHRGLHGVAYTVFEGVTPEPMEVEILGVLKDSLGPGKDMILARLKGTKPEYTGVVAGMSGSPVYIDGRLVGALSFRIGQFSKEPIAGITPIEQMLEVRDGAGGPEVKTVAAVRTGERMPVEATPIDTPLVFGGFSEEAVERFGDRFRAMGMTPVAGLGGSDAKAVQPEPLVPGSAVSAVIVRGDLSMAGTCTVTYVDPQRLLACGHPITQFGQVDLPMTKADVVATLASPLNAFKIVNTTETVGAFTEDRSSAILGRFGVQARMIPVEVTVVPKGAPAKAKTMRFEVVDNRQLTPSAMLVSVYQSLQGTNVSAAEMSYKLSGEMGVQGETPVQMQGVMAQSALNPGSIETALYVYDGFSRVYGTLATRPVITGLKLRAEAIPEQQTAVIESARTTADEVHAGETVDVEVTLRPYRLPVRRMHVAVKLPQSLAPGALRMVVSDGTTVDRMSLPEGAAPQRAMGLADTIAAMNARHANDRVYVTLLEHEAQATLASGAMGAVPLSMANVLDRQKDSQQVQLHGESAVEAGSEGTDYAVSGQQVVTLTVR